MVASAFSEDGEPSPEAQAAARALWQAGNRAHYKALALDQSVAELETAVRAAHAAGILQEDVLPLAKANMLTAMHPDVLALARTMIRREYKEG